MNGRYGWFNATRVYNLPIYVSGIGFKSKRLYDSYISKKKEITDAYHNLDREHEEARQNLRLRIGEEYTQEEQEIIDNAKQAGTYLKAPNGADTNLTPKQWAQVRTKAFKDWFGDWEKAARIEKLRHSEPVKITGEEITPSDDFKQYKKNALEYGKSLRGEYTNKDTGEKISLTGGNSRGGIREILQHDYKDIEHLQSIAAIPKIIENSVFIDEFPNEDVDKYKGVKSFSYYVCGLKIGNENYTVKAVIANQSNGERYYDHRLSRIEKGELLSILPTIQKAGIEGNSPLSDFKDKRLLSILQVNSSKVVDENGEPMVVYHGDPNATIDIENTIKTGRAVFNMPFNIFRTDSGEGKIERGAFSHLFPTGFYGYESIFFLNIKKPKYINESLTENNVISFEDEGFDGVIRDEIGTASKENPEIVVFYPTQIKSATDNVGTFSEDNPNIRFRFFPKNRRRQGIEFYDINHKRIANNVKKFVEENFEQGTYEFTQAKSGSFYLKSKIGGSDVEVRIANHTKKLGYDQAPHLLGDGFSIDFYKDGSVNVSIDIAQNGMTDVEINQFLKGLKEYENSPIKERVMLLLEGADTIYPNIAEGEMANQLYEMIGDRFVESINSTIRENHHYVLNQEIGKQENIMQKSQANIRFTIDNALKDDIFHWYATTSDKMLYDISGGYWFNATNGYLKITPNILKGSIFFDQQSIEKKLVSAYFVPARGVNKRKAKKEAIQEYVSDYVTTLSNAPIYDSDKIIEGGSNIVQARYMIDQLKEEYNIWHSAKFGYPAPDVVTRFRRMDMPDVSTLVTENNGVYEVNLQNLLPEEEDRVREIAKSMSDVTITGDIAKFPDRDMAENAVRNAMMFYGELSDEITNIPYDVTPLDVMEKLDNRIKKGKLKRVWIDQYQPLNALQTIIEKKLGITIPENLNAWEATGYMDSLSAAQLEEYKMQY